MTTIISLILVTLSIIMSIICMFFEDGKYIGFFSLILSLLALGFVLGW